MNVAVATLGGGIFHLFSFCKNSRAWINESKDGFTFHICRWWVGLGWFTVKTFFLVIRSLELSRLYILGDFAGETVIPTGSAYVIHVSADVHGFSTIRNHPII